MKPRRGPVNGARRRKKPTKGQIERRNNQTQGEINRLRAATQLTITNLTKQLTDAKARLEEANRRIDALLDAHDLWDNTEIRPVDPSEPISEPSEASDEDSIKEGAQDSSV